MPGRSIEDLLIRAKRVATTGTSRGIGVAVGDDLALVYCDFAAFVTMGRRPTGIVLPPNTLIDGGFIYTKVPVVGSYELLVNVGGDLGGPISNSPVGVGLPLPQLIVGEDGAPISIQSAANVTAGVIAAYINIKPLP
jgi:hypothetical protein